MKNLILLFLSSFILISSLYSNRLFIRNDSLVSDLVSTELKELDLSDFSMNVLPLNLAAFSSIESLNLSQNDLKSIKGVSSLKKLKTLILNDNPRLKVSEVNLELEKIKSLQHFSATGCKLAFFPSSLSNLTALQTINLSGNSIQIIPSHIRQLDSLLELNLSNNQIQFIDNGILGLGRLMRIDLQGNKIENLPHLFYQLAILKNLESLSIDYESASYFTKKSVRLKNVSTLHLFNFNENFEASYLKLFSELKFLEIEGDASSEDYTQLIEEIAGAKLKSVRIKSSTLTELPYALTNCDKLEQLEIVCSNFSKVPSFMNRFQNLKILKIEVDQLNLHDCLLNLIPIKSLQKLSITVNTDVEIPPSISKLKRLDTLVICAKKVQELPSSLNQLKNLSQVQLYVDNSVVENLDDLQLEMPTCEFVLNSNVLERNVNGLTPPIANVDVAYENILVSASKSQIITTASGTTLKIPANAFLNSDGEVITGNVRIAYREFNDPIDMAFAGIPMTEEINEEFYTYASAGMLEFEAFQQANPLFPNPEQLITVNYNSPFDGNEYDLFELDPNSSNWKTIGKDSIGSAPDVELAIEEFTTDILVRPVYPSFPYSKQSVWLSYKRYKRKKKQSKKNSPLVIHNNSRRTRRDTTSKVYSEFRHLNKMKFKIDYSFYEKDYNKELDDLIDEIFAFNRASTRLNGRKNNVFGWGNLTYIDDLRLEPNIERDNFNLVIVRAGLRTEIPVNPTTVPRKTEVAQRKLKQYFKNYTKHLNRRVSDWEKVEKRNEEKVVEYENSIKNFEEDQAIYYDKLAKLNEQELASLKTFAATENNVIRSFSLMSFGIFNVDIKQRIEVTKPILAALQDSSGNDIVPKKLLILDKGNNGLLSFDNPKKAFFDYRSINSVIAILKNDKIGIIKSKDFNKDLIASRRAFVKMDIYDMKKTTIEELRKSAEFF